MKKLLTISLLIILSVTSRSQTSVFADPAVGSLDITNNAGISVDANNLQLNSIYQVKMTMFNLDQVNAIPSGTCRIRIGLGTKLILDPAFDLANAPLNQYFHWTYESTGSQGQIFGDLYNPLPPDFVGIVSFGVKANIIGTSTVSGHFLISNNNPLFTLSDTDPNNNAATLSYTIIEVIPVKFVSLDGLIDKCDATIIWKVETEYDLDHYEAEVSTNGVNFIRQALVSAANKPVYSTRLNDVFKAGSQIFIRIKSVDKDSSFEYSETILLKGSCDGGKSALLIYPNPIINNTVRIEYDLPKGSYLIQVIAPNGQIVYKKPLIHPGGTNHSSLFLPNLASATYSLSIAGISATLVSKFIK